MASWMVHLRVADLLIERLEGIAKQEFVMGNIAPDSGVPNADWTAYAPPSQVSHFKMWSAIGNSILRQKNGWATAGSNTLSIWAI